MGVDVTFLAEGDGKLNPILLRCDRVDCSADAESNRPASASHAYFKIFIF